MAAEEDLVGVVGAEDEWPLTLSRSSGLSLWLDGVLLSVLDYERRKGGEGDEHWDGNMEDLTRSRHMSSPYIKLEGVGLTAEAIDVHLTLA